MEELKWSIGIEYKKSRKVSKPKKENYQIPNSQEEAHQLSLGDIDNFNRKESITFSLKDTKRDKANEKIGMRQMTEQTNMNPFRTNNNYISDIEVQENFLRPKNTNDPA